MKYVIFLIYCVPNGLMMKTENSPDSEDTHSAEQETDMIPVLVSHKTEFPKYRRAGLVLTRQPENILVTAEQFEELKRDPWVSVSQ